MILNAVLAVALGLAPSNSQTVRGDDYLGLIGRYSQSTDQAGTTHLSGFDQSGRPYNIAVTASGHVEGLVGATYVTFDYSRVS